MASSSEGAPSLSMSIQGRRPSKLDLWIFSELLRPQSEIVEEVEGTERMPQSDEDEESTQEPVKETPEQILRRKDREEKAKSIAEENVEIFKGLVEDPENCGFFCNIGSHIFLGKKIGCGRQADIYDLTNSEGFVAKVFKKDISLRDQQIQWPKVMLRGGHFYGQDTSLIECGFMTQDGRFAFLMAKLSGDLRSLIDSIKEQNEAREEKRSPPFTYQEAKSLLLQIASGMKSLHDAGILHRDLKSANVLYQRTVGNKIKCYVADFECSVEVLGTGFFRAPEILLAKKAMGSSTDRAAEKDFFDTITRESDVYSYAMTCYEILTGKNPFANCYDCDIVLDEGGRPGKRPELPSFIEPELSKLIQRCWHGDASQRPSFEDILKILSKLASSPDQVTEVDGVEIRVGNFFLNLVSSAFINERDAGSGTRIIIHNPQPGKRMILDDGKYADDLEALKDIFGRSTEAANMSTSRPSGPCTLESNDSQ